MRDAVDIPELTLGRNEDKIHRECDLMELSPPPELFLPAINGRVTYTAAGYCAAKTCLRSCSLSQVPRQLLCPPSIHQPAIGSVSLSMLQVLSPGSSPVQREQSLAAASAPGLQPSSSLQGFSERSSFCKEPLSLPLHTGMFIFFSPFQS